ncbi:MAG TPA: hypothetical protein VFR50_06250 [Casimicrobiaceae bacterium]|nr:hypothetical protein [Casimicrobiaceae bacterium]
MNVATIGVMGFAAALLFGCATTDSTQLAANNQDKECKGAAIYSQADRQGRASDSEDLRQAEARMELGRLRVNQPGLNRTPFGPNESNISKTLRDC